MYSIGYSRLFWAMVFIVFDFNLGAINILPGFVGYLLFHSGLNILSNQHEIFSRGKGISLVLVLLTLKDIVKFPNNAFAVAPLDAITMISTVVGVLTSVLSLYLIYITCRGIYLVAEERGQGVLMESAKTTWWFYLVIACSMMLYLPFSLNMPREYVMLGMLIAIVYIIASVGLALLFSRAKSQLAE